VLFSRQRSNDATEHDIEDNRMTIERLTQGCVLPQRSLREIQNGTMNYKYKGVPMYKSPFDLALYQLVLWEQKPRTLIEIGSKWGGSALWFSDVLNNYGTDYSIHSIDIEVLDRPKIPRVTFYRGDGKNISETLSREFLIAMPRPIMVIEDADHHWKTTLSILHFFDNWLQPGEFIIIEDGIVDDLFKNDQAIIGLDGGPRRAITEFIQERGDDYQIDTRLCDYFGTNVTWNVNGYLQRVR
jgi:cephalosporin hydroxylase